VSKFPHAVKRARDLELVEYLKGRTGLSALAARLLARYEERARASEIDRAISRAIEERGATTEEIVAAIGRTGRRDS
jgi:hypothetical protein